MPICPLHRIVYQEPAECYQCRLQGIQVLSVEYDKQDRARDTMTCQGHEFLPTRSRAIMVFKKIKF
jgi:hypothetical protein